MQHLSRYILLCLMLILLSFSTACHRHRARDEIEKYVQKIKATHKKQTHSVINKMSSNHKINKRKNLNANNIKSSKLLNCRERNIDLNQFGLIGSMMLEKRKIALLRLPNRAVISVVEGERLGKNCATLEKITQNCAYFMSSDKRLALYMDNEK
jgi:hypothetical protein